LPVVEEVADRLNWAIADEETPGTETYSQVYVVDGTTLRIAHTKENIAQYPLHTNQRGTSHFPVLRVAIATNARTGVALRPAIGPFSGSNAASELSLSRELMQRLPAKSLLIGDRYYGCFIFAYHASSHGHQVLCRMKEANTKKVIGSPGEPAGEKCFTWHPSKREREKYPWLPVEAALDGKFVWTKLACPGFRSETLFFFTTLDLTADKLLELYKLRWNVELDLRDIKSTLSADQIEAKTPAMVNKEIILAVTAYNLVRKLMTIAAIKLRLDPRSLSFSRMLKRINALSASILADTPNPTIDYRLRNALVDLRGLVLPSRKKHRPNEPRKAWSRGQTTLLTSSRDEERKKLNPPSNITTN
jgi:hypothetical protein